MNPAPYSAFQIEPNKQSVLTALRTDQIQQLYASAPIGYCGTVIATLAATIVLSSKIAPRLALIWIGITVLVALCRALLSWHFSRCLPQEKGDERWLRWFQISVFASGVAWGIGAVLMLVGNNITHQMLMLLLLLGMITAGVYSYAIHLPAFICFAMPIAAGSVLGQWTTGDPDWRIYLTFTSLIYIISAVWFAKLLSRSLCHAITLQHQNRAMAEALHQKSLLSEKASLAKSRFLAAASHDLRQPVHALGLFLSSLSRMELSPSARQTVAEMESCTAAANDLFSSILDTSRLEAGVVQPDCASIAIAPFARRIVAEHQAMARAKGLSFGFYLSPQLEQAYVMSDGTMLERILRNLLQNAIRYTRQGGVLLALRQHGEHVVIQVWDTGTGIPKEQLGEIYQEFIQLQPRDKEQRQGRGLGLYIVKRLCILLGHPIEVRSRVNRGTRFEIRVPLTQTVQPTPAATRADQPFLDEKFILVLDDDLIIVRALTGLLEGWGARVYGTSTVDELLAASAGFDRCPDLILSDFHLQGSHNQRADVLDGIASVARLRDEFAHNIPALLITGESDPARLRQAKSSGLLVLHKPLKAETLAAHLGTLFGYQPAARAASTA